MNLHIPEDPKKFVVCISNDSEARYKLISLTKGKIYKVLDETGSDESKSYLIINDIAQRAWYTKQDLMTIEEIRDSKLDDIGI